MNIENFLFLPILREKVLTQNIGFLPGLGAGSLLREGRFYAVLLRCHSLALRAVGSVSLAGASGLWVL
ncbi:MAG TPA: hypothetical protein DDZ51_17790 [Planctomycetaceae bacterium]|nr:hypothetical protein [Planctomycetaceae bacterium]